jgi:hypothetical protein
LVAALGWWTGFAYGMAAVAVTVFCATTTRVWDSGFEGLLVLVGLLQIAGCVLLYLR